MATIVYLTREREIPEFLSLCDANQASLTCHQELFYMWEIPFTLVFTCIAYFPDTLDRERKFVYRFGARARFRRSVVVNVIVA